MIDVHTYIGGYPFRHLPHPDPEVLVRVLAREAIDQAWVAHLPTAFHRDPTPGNRELLRLVAPFAPVLLPVPAIRPDWPGWRRELEGAARAGAPAVRAYPPQWSLGPDDPRMRELRDACGALGMSLALAVRFEDLRQRHPLDIAGDLSAASIRYVARDNGGARLVVLGAGRELIEEVHWGLTPAERELLWWDISWIWGPPEDELARLFRTMGSERFLFGTGWPLRLTQTPRANLDLLPDDVRGRPLADPATWTGVVR